MMFNVIWMDDIPEKCLENVDNFDVEEMIARRAKLIERLLKSCQRQKKGRWKKWKNQKEEASIQGGKANRSKTTWTKPDLLCWWLTTNWWLLQNHTLNAFSIIFSIFSLTFLTQFHWMIIIKPFIIQISFKIQKF